MASFFDFLNDVTYGKQNLVESGEALLKDYNSFMVNRGLSNFADTVLYANEMNRYAFLDKDIQYKYYLEAIPKKKRFSKWHKKDKSEDIELIKMVYSVNDIKARDILDILDSSQLDILKQQQNKGGKK